MIAAIQERSVKEQQARSKSNIILAGEETAQFAGSHLRRFTLEEYQRLVELGIFQPEERLELMNGLIVEMSPINPPHADCVDRLNEVLVSLFKGRARVRPQSPISLEVRSAQPQPDLALIAWRSEGYRKQHPGAGEILLIIEVSDSTLEKDREEKLEMYAAAGIPEYWIANLVDEQFEVYRDPYISATGEADYKTKLTFARNQTLAPLKFPECEIAVDEVMPVAPERE